MGQALDSLTGTPNARCSTPLAVQMLVVATWQAVRMPNVEAAVFQFENVDIVRHGE